jgi:hexosaminidase
MNRLAVPVACLLAVLNLLTCQSQASPESTEMKPPHIIPQPLSIETHPGSMEITRRTVIAYPISNADLKFVAGFLKQALKSSTGLQLRIVDLAKRPEKNYIVLGVGPDDTTGKEGYRLNATDEGVTIVGGEAAGTFYGVQTLLQLLPPEVYSSAPARRTSWTIPSVSIQDKPRFGWRGMMLDVSRHFFPKSFVKKFIDYLAMHKMNTFHWHLCDDQGWRLEIKKHPRLTKVSAWRVDREGLYWNVRPPQKAGERATYGGFYTQKDIKDVVEYAAARHITVVPEIEMPAHATAVVAAYPQFSCTGGPFTVPPGGLWPIKDIYCAGNDSVFAFLEDVLSEVSALFPGKFIHIGGDEADKTEWRRCPKCQARIKTEGLKNEAELQSYFIKKIEKVLASQGKRLIGWDEILEGGLAPQATVMSWRGTIGGIEAAKSGHDVVMSPTSNCYFDYYQGDPQFEPVAIGGFLPIKTVYSFEPTPDTLTSEEAKHILGTQANLWAEFSPDGAKVEYMAFPRIAAIAEVGWSARTRREWGSFAERLEVQLKRYRARGINTSRTPFSVAMRDSFDAPNGRRIVELRTEIGQDRIRYTTDGSAPGPGSALYATPLVLRKETSIAATTFRGNERLGDVRRKTYFLTPSGPMTATLLSPLDPPYVGDGASALVDNRRASGGSRDKQWVGVQGKDFKAVIDLGNARTIRRISAGFYHSSAELMFLPAMVTYEVSLDGVKFRKAASLKNSVSPKTERPFVKDFVANLKRTRARYIRFTARSLVTTPGWHKMAGQPVWLLTDEVFAE